MIELSSCLRDEHHQPQQTNHYYKGYDNDAVDYNDGRAGLLAPNPDRLYSAFYLAEEVGITRPLLLEDGWSFWYDKYIGPGRPVEDYAAALRNLGSFGTVEEFWSYYNNLPSPMQLRPGNSMHLMKLGVVPLWEDPVNARGGSFSVRVPKNQTAKAWLYVLLAAIGEQFYPALASSGDDLCGVSVSVRRGGYNVILMWNRDARLFDLSSFYGRLVDLVPNAGLSHPVYKPHFTETDSNTPISEEPTLSPKLPP